MRYNLEDVRRQFDITEKDTLGFAIFLLNMEQGDILSGRFVTIKKVDEFHFEISKSKGVENLVADLMTSPEAALRRSIFGPDNPE